MFRDHLDNLPEIQHIAGYATRTYRSGDEAAWCRIMEGNVGSNWTTEKCRAQLINDPRFQADNLFFITHNDDPIASACAWKTPAQSPENGRSSHGPPHTQTHRGKGLGAFAQRPRPPSPKRSGLSESTSQNR